jgi:hypothetical protein
MKRRVRRVLGVIGVAGLLAGLLVGVQAAPAQATIETDCPRTGNVKSCLKIEYEFYPPTGGYRVTRAAASLTLYNDCTTFPSSRYTNLWKNVRYKESTSSDVSECVGGTFERGMFWNVEYWDTADGDPARIFPANTRFHSTWQNIDDNTNAHPLIWVP